MHMEVWDLCITLFIKGNITKLNSSLLIKTYNSKHCTLKTYLVKTLEYDKIRMKFPTENISTPMYCISIAECVIREHSHMTSDFLGR